MPDTLKPCPFCGSPATLDPEGGHWAMCSNHECHQHYGAAPTSAAWNHRAPSPEVERLVALANHITDALGPYRDLNGHAVVYEANAALAAYKEAQR